MITAKKQAAIQALLTCRTKAEAALAAGISPRTLSDYLADAEFQREYRKAVAQAIDSTARQAQRAMSPALAVLQDIMQDKEESSSSKIAAARTLLEYGLRLSEFNDIVRELQSITGD